MKVWGKGRQARAVARTADLSLSTHMFYWMQRPLLLQLRSDAAFSNFQGWENGGNPYRQDDAGLDHWWRLW